MNKRERPAGVEPRRYMMKLVHLRPCQEKALHDARRLHCVLYNAALAQRIDAYEGNLHPIDLTPPDRPALPVGETREERLERLKAQDAAKRERVAWAKEFQTSRTLGLYDQQHELKNIRASRPEYAAMSATTLEMTLARLDNAYKAFYQRAKSGAGASSGFPRFKRGEDYPGWTHRKHKNGWRVEFGGFEKRQGIARGPRNGWVEIKGIPGRLKFRGMLPQSPEELRTMDVIWRDGAWWLSLAAEFKIDKPKGNANGEIDFTLIDEFAVLKTANGPRGSAMSETVFAIDDRGKVHEVQGRKATSDAAGPESRSERRGDVEAHRVRVDADGPESRSERGRRGVLARPSPDADGPESRIADLQRQMDARKPKPGQRASGTYKKLKRRKAKLEGKAARRRREGLHEWSTGLAVRLCDLRIYKPDIKDVTTSGRGDERDWGAAVETKADVNNRILGQAPALAIQMLKYKIAERGGRTEVVVDDKAPATAGNATVRLAKMARRTKRNLKREKELLHV